MSLHRRVWICSIATLLLLAHIAASPAAEPRKVAFLIGVSKYDKAGLDSLAYAEDDVTALGKKLHDDAGFYVEILTGSGEGEKRATRLNIRTQLEEKFAKNIKRLNKDDMVLIALSGHGQQLDVEKNGRQVEDHFYCPVDALKTDPDTLLSVGDLIELIGRNSGAENNLFVIDACRNNPAKGAKGLDGSRISLPRNMAALFGSSSGKQSYESDTLHHGLLTHCLLDGLDGAAKDNDGDVTWDSLVNYTKKQVSKNSVGWVGNQQNPNSISNINGSPPVLRRISVQPATPEVKPTDSKPAESKTANSKPATFDPKTVLVPPVPTAGLTEGKKVGELREDNGLKMKLVWCPKGSFKMGEDGEVADVTLDSGFWLGQTGVTQLQWKDVMGTAPWSGKEFVKEGTDYPATYVSVKAADDFVKKLNEKERATKRLPAGWRYALPSGSQREYATRAATTTRYSFGDDESKLSEYGWFNRNTEAAKEQFAHRVAQKKPNPWGFYDLHGNVFEWTSDVGEAKLPDGTDLLAGRFSRSGRGGCWSFEAEHCRSVSSYGIAGDGDGSDSGDSGFGLRVAMVPSIAIK